MTDNNKAESEPKSDDLLNEITSELVDDVKSNAKEETQPAELPAENKEDNKQPEQETEKPVIDSVVQASIDKRIAKEVSKRKKLETELAEAKAKAEILENQASTKTESDTISDTTLENMSPEQLDTADKEAREYMVWAMNGPMEEGFETTDKNGETKYYSPEEIKENYQFYHRRAMLDIPEQKRKQQNIAGKLDALAKEYPALQNPDSKEYQAFKEVWQSAEFADMKNNMHAPQLAWYISQGKSAVGNKQPTQMKPPTYVPTAPAPKIPTAPAPSRAKVYNKAETREINATDIERIQDGKIDDVVAKLLQ